MEGKVPSIEIPQEDDREWVCYRCRHAYFQRCSTIVNNWMNHMSWHKCCKCWYQASPVYWVVYQLLAPPVVHLTLPLGKNHQVAIVVYSPVARAHIPRRIVYMYIHSLGIYSKPLNHKYTHDHTYLFIFPRIIRNLPLPPFPIHTLPKRALELVMIPEEGHQEHIRSLTTQAVEGNARKQNK